MKKKVAVIVGSLRKASYNRMLANELIRIAPDSLEMKIVEFGDLPSFNEDLDVEGQQPASWTRFRNEVNSFDAVLFVTPEYNRSIPGGLKNAIDVGSRPYGQSVWAGKSGAVISTTPGGYGAFGANHVLRQSMVFLDVKMLQQPEMYLSNIQQSFDESGHLVEKTEAFVQGFLSAFEKWVRLF